MAVEKKIYGIEINFENMEIIVIPRQYIAAMNFRGITRTIRKYSSDDHVTEIECCNEVLLVISPMADKRENLKFAAAYDEYLPFERIKKGQDIASIGIRYLDKSVEEIYVPWKSEDGNDLKNEYQQVNTDKDNNLVILIEEKEESPCTRRC